MTMKRKSGKSREAGSIIQKACLPEDFLRSAVNPGEALGIVTGQGGEQTEGLEELELPA